MNIKDLIQAVRPRAHVVVQPLPDGRKKKILRAIDERIGTAADDKPWIVSVPEGTLLYEQETIDGLLAGINRLRVAAAEVIDLNRANAHDQYGDANKAETWSCVRVLRAALLQEQE